LTQLSQDHVAILRLSFYEDQPHSQIARQLGIPLGTVKTHARRGILRAREILGLSEDITKEVSA